jgi:hypothetical protein
MVSVRSARFTALETRRAWAGAGRMPKQARRRAAAEILCSNFMAVFYHMYCWMMMPKIMPLPVFVWVTLGSFSPKKPNMIPQLS